jgi:hypothetical protein|tara:strand:- start:318 stop:569 length:252 start_codon:yes stop_codon:yes gene_type:complete
MKKRTRSILEELNNLGSKSRSDDFIQTTGSRIIESSINLLTKIYETYDEADAIDLERRFINSIRAANSKKFKVGIDKIKESKR